MGSQNKSGETAGTPAADPKEHYRALSDTLQTPALKANFGYLAIKLGNPQVPQRY